MTKKNIGDTAVFQDVKTFIEQSKQEIAVTVNSGLSLLYWKIGKRIHDELLKQQRAEYGKKIVVTLAKQLTEEYGKGWSEKQLRHCLRFAETITDKEILYAVSRELTWTNTRTLNLYR